MGVIRPESNVSHDNKISLYREIANLCNTVSAYKDDASRGNGADPDIGPHFLNAGIGHSVSCLPKDSWSLDFYAAISGHQSSPSKSWLNERLFRVAATAWMRMRCVIRVASTRPLVD